MMGSQWMRMHINILVLAQLQLLLAPNELNNFTQDQSLVEEWMKSAMLVVNLLAAIIWVTPPYSDSLLVLSPGATKLTRVPQPKATRLRQFGANDGKLPPKSEVPNHTESTSPSDCITRPRGILETATPFFPASDYLRSHLSGKIGTQLLGQTFPQ